MKDVLQNSLYEAFPLIFQDRTKPMTESLMCFGLSVGDGWYELIRKLCEDIMATNPPETFRAVQVKEKFGGLRFYCAGGTFETGELIDAAEAESYKICENCGSRENVTSEGGWIKTLCAACNQK